VRPRLRLADGDSWSYNNHSHDTSVRVVDDHDDTVVAALRASARGYVLKGAPGDVIAAAVRTVAGGGAVSAPAAPRKCSR